MAGALLNVFSMNGVEWKLVWTVKRLYEKNEACVELEIKEREFVPVRVGLVHGWVMSA